MEEFITEVIKVLANKGLSHIVKYISRCEKVHPDLEVENEPQKDENQNLDPVLDVQEYEKTVERKRQWLIYQLEQIHSEEKIFTDYEFEDQPKVKSSIKNRFPEWNAFVEEVSKSLDVVMVQVFIKYMWIYFKDESISYECDPFHDAIASNSMFAQLLIISGIDLKMKTPAGSTPFHTACEFGNNDAVKILLQKSNDVDIYKKNIYQHTAEDLARLNGHTHILELIELSSLPNRIEAIEAKLKTEKARFYALRMKYSNEAENHKTIFECIEYFLDLF